MTYKEQEEQTERLKAEFEMNVFANNQKLYFDMFEKDYKEVEEKIEWVRPQNQEDVDAIIEKLKSAPA